MQAHKMLLEEVEEEEYSLVAIYSTAEDYKMAFLLNKHLKLGLKRERKDVDFNHPDGKAFYPRFTFRDPANFCNYDLVGNIFRGETQKISEAGSLFTEQEVRPLETFLLPEYKKVNYFLVIKDDSVGIRLKKKVNIISGIPQVIAAHMVDTDRLNSKQNLIFE